MEDEEEEVVHLLALAEILSKAEPAVIDSKNIKSVHLLEELIEEILSRLPVKSLSRFKCVSKSWLSLISSQRFIEAHRQNSTKNRVFSHHKVLFEFMEGVFKQCSLQQLLTEASSIKPSPINDPTNNHPSYPYVVGCCNGLLCLLGIFCLSLWNPATMIFKKLPYFNGLGFKCGFGWDGAYKVFALSHHLGISKGNVYSSNTNSWKTVDSGSLLPVHDSYGVFSWGKIHWIIKRSEDNYIESFDLGSEEFGRIDLPFKTPKYHFGRQYKLAEIGGCLHFVCVDIPDKQTCVVIVWVLKESGWLKLFTHPLSSVIRYHPIPLCGGGPNGEIFLIIRDKFLVYDGKDVIVLPASKNIEYMDKGHVYVESLVSPNFTTAG